MKKLILIALLGFPCLVKAQDSTTIVPVEKPSHQKCTHEIDFNTTYLIKQLLSNNPTSTLPQLPYQLMYTLGFSNGYGLRLGVGFDQSTQKTNIQGQTTPRTTNFINGAYRLNLVKNLLNYKRITCIGFAGGIADQAKIETTTVTDQGGFGGGTIKSELTNKSTSYGGELGVGLKFSINKHIAVAVEVPLQCKYTVSSELDKQTITNSSFVTTTNQTITETKGMSTKIFLPTSLFFCIIF